MVLSSDRARSRSVVVFLSSLARSPRMVLSRLMARSGTMVLSTSVARSAPVGALLLLGPPSDAGALFSVGSLREDGALFLSWLAQLTWCSLGQRLALWPPWCSRRGTAPSLFGSLRTFGALTVNGSLLLAGALYLNGSVSRSSHGAMTWACPRCATAYGNGGSVPRFADASRHAGARGDLHRPATGHGMDMAGRKLAAGVGRIGVGVGAEFALVRILAARSA